MRLPSPISINELRDIIRTDFTVKGDPDNVIRGINEIHSVEEGDLSFVDNEKYYDRMLRSKATVILINKDTECPAGKTLLVTDDPLQAYLKAVRHYISFHPQTEMIHPTARIGEGTIIQPGFTHNRWTAKKCDYRSWT